ncbi:hypothetical protein [Kaistia terrae]|uniref:Uncharacterized protein n=1 Tax=Kaistia terrae TaxID=537017 RepID=A0ABW0PW21_9HYPH|nr:hypothetical protein [Kaistia terrae]MCX5577030.1 hypothetical protein [Kaistia terrae]
MIDTAARIDLLGKALDERSDSVGLHEPVPEQIAHGPLQNAAAELFALCAKA